MYLDSPRHAILHKTDTRDKIYPQHSRDQPYYCPSACYNDTCNYFLPPIANIHYRGRDKDSKIQRSTQPDCVKHMAIFNKEFTKVFTRKCQIMHKYIQCQSQLQLTLQHRGMGVRYRSSLNGSFVGGSNGRSFVISDSLKICKFNKNIGIIIAYLVFVESHFLRATSVP